jgi:hypothetical protein
MYKLASRLGFDVVFAVNDLALFLLTNLLLGQLVHPRGSKAATTSRAS